MAYQPTTNTTDIIATGTIAALSATVQLDLNGASSITVNAAGALSASTVVFEWTADGTTWTSWPVMAPGGTNGITGTPTSSSGFGSANLLFWGMAPGFKSVRVRCTVYGSGSTSVTMRASASTALGYYPTQVNSPGDGLVAPTAVQMNSTYGQIFNLSTWDRVRSITNSTNSTGTGITAAGILAQFDDVSPTAITENQFGNVRMSTNRNLYNTVRDAAGNERGVNVTAGNALQSDLTSVAGTAAAVNNGTASAGTQRVTVASDNTPFPIKIDQTTPGTTNAVVNTAVTSGGLSIVTGSVGGTATAIKASAGQLYGYHLFNTTAAVAYVQIFNLAVGSVTLGTTAPTFSIGIPASGGVTVDWDKGIAFGTAISYACTTTRAGSTGATCDVNFFYK